jgi:hypothetical protein
MITVETFTIIRNEVIDALTEAFKLAQANSVDNAFLIFLAEGAYHESGDPKKYNPFTIDNRIDRYIDETRQSYLVTFLNTYYTFKGGQPTTDTEETLHLDLMVYTHLWEVKAFLKKLFRLVQIIDKKPYQWKVDVPDFSKQDWYRKHIKAPIKFIGCKLATVLENGFHSSLRNAFAHSEFSFDFQNKRIWLYNYKGEPWELQEISFDDWSTRFAYSFLTSYLLFDLFHTTRKAISTDGKNKQFQINHANIDGTSKVVTVVYRPDADAFSFKTTNTN